MSHIIQPKVLSFYLSAASSISSEALSCFKFLFDSEIIRSSLFLSFVSCFIRSSVVLSLLTFLCNIFVILLFHYTNQFFSLVLQIFDILDVHTMHLLSSNIAFHRISTFTSYGRIDSLQCLIPFLPIVDFRFALIFHANPCSTWVLCNSSQYSLFFERYYLYNKLCYFVLDRQTTNSFHHFIIFLAWFS